MARRQCRHKRERDRSYARTRPITTVRSRRTAPEPLTAPTRPLVSRLFRPPTRAYQSTNSTSGNFQARIYDATGHIALAEPDLSGDPFGNVITFAPPAVVINGSSYNLGPVQSVTNITNGLQIVQAFAGIDHHRTAHLYQRRCDALRSHELEWIYSDRDRRDCGVDFD